MDLNRLLNQVLGGGAGASHGQGRSDGRSDMGKYLVGGAAGGALGLLLGSKRGRGMGGKALKYGSVAALGALAYKLYQDHQAQQRAPASPAGPAMGSVPAGGPAAAYQAPAELGASSFARLPAPAQEQHAQLMLKAIIAAAKSDGHLDARERGLLNDELARLSADAETRAWVEAEIARPIDPADVAAAATRPGAAPEMAAEVYLASLIVVDETTTMERAYLDELARQLKLPADLKARLEAQAREAA